MVIGGLFLKKWTAVKLSILWLLGHIANYILLKYRFPLRFMKLTESTDKGLTGEQINALRFSVGWCTKRSEEKWREILDKSSFVYSVFDKDKLVGMGRIVEDGVMCMFYDIIVHKDYQGAGVGKMIMNNLLDFTKDKKYSSISLFADPDNRDFLISFYNKFG